MKAITKEEQIIKNLKWEEVKRQEPPFRLKVVSETWEVLEDIKVHGSVMGRDGFPKHVRFYHTETNTAYIRWNAPDSLRLLITDKDPNAIIYVQVEPKEKETEKARKSPTCSYENTQSSNKEASSTSVPCSCF